MPNPLTADDSSDMESTREIGMAREPTTSRSLCGDRLGGFVDDNDGADDGAAVVVPEADEFVTVGTGVVVNV